MREALARKGNDPKFGSGRSCDRGKTNDCKNQKNNAKQCRFGAASFQTEGVKQRKRTQRLVIHLHLHGDGFFHKCNNLPSQAKDRFFFIDLL